jgi:hypothetical protein
MRLHFLLLLAAISPVRAEWRRFLVETTNTDPAPPHTFSYFSHDAILRPEVQEITQNTAGEQTEIVKIGEVRGLAVFDVTYQVRSMPVSKSIIVKTGPDEYREIFYAPEFSGGRFYPTQIVSTSEDQTLLWFRVDKGGNRHFIEDFLFQLDPKGPTRLDLDPVLKVANSILPAGVDLYIWNMELLASTSTFTLHAPVVGSCPKGNERPRNSASCGVVEVDFRLEGEHIAPLGRRYIP